MPVEIERKFIVVGDGWRDGRPGQRFCQGYLAQRDGVTVRVRSAGGRAYVTKKGEANRLVRPEFEYDVPVGEAEERLRRLCSRPLSISLLRRLAGAGGLGSLSNSLQSAAPDAAGIAMRARHSNLKQGNAVDLRSYGLST